MVLGLAMLLAGCEKRYRDVTLYQSTGGSKPIVAVLPVIDRSTNDSRLSWDLAREFTDQIRDRVYNSTHLYLLRQGGSLEVAKQLATPNARALGKESMEELGAAEYVVVTEFLGEKMSPRSLMRADSERVDNVGATFNVALRVRLYDLRKEQPKLILQEVIEHEDTVARAYLTCDYNRNGWGTEAFETTPIGMAHARIVRELVSRVEGYVEANRG